MINCSSHVFLYFRAVDTTDIQFAQSSYEILEDIGSDDSALRVCLIVSQLASERSVRILTVSGTAQGLHDFFVVIFPLQARLRAGYFSGELHDSYCIYVSARGCYGSQ